MKTQPLQPAQDRLFKQVDVFSAQPYLGNPVAVVLDGTDLSEAQMQQFAHWTNLSETTFLLPPSVEGAAHGADYRVRIFTTGGELPFAGHPTLGSCHAWLEAGGSPRASGAAGGKNGGQSPVPDNAGSGATKAIGGQIPIQDSAFSGVTNNTTKLGSDPQLPTRQFFVQECAVGLVRIRRSGTRLAFAAPPLKRSAPSPALVAQVAAALGLKTSQIIAAQMLDNGPLWLGLLLDSRRTVLQLAPDHLALKNLGQKVGVASVEPALQATPLIARSNREARAFGPRSAEAAVDAATELEVRAFAAPLGILEDPVTGSFNASLAQWLMADGLAPRAYVASQGTGLGRAGHVHIEQDVSGQVWVGGDCVTCIDGRVKL